MNTPIGLALSRLTSRLVLTLAGTLSAWAGAPADPSGHITLPDGISARATILVEGAKPKEPSQSTQFTHRPALPLQVQADAQGNFTVPSLDADWLYFGYVLAPGCRLQQFGDLAPASHPLAVNLQAAHPAEAAPGTLLLGRVMSPEGRPIGGALVDIHGVTRNGSTRWPACDIDVFAVSDADGTFAIYGKTPFTAAEGGVQAEGFATGLFEHWTPGAEVHELTLVRGAAIQGKLLQAGKPVPNAEVRLDNFGAEADSDLWHYSALTDSQGQFIFAHLPPDRHCSICATMESLGQRGSLGKHVVQTHESDSTNDVGILELAPAFRVEGRIQLSDGKPLPAGSALFINRAMSGRQDSLRCTAGKDGTFHFVGVPPEPVQVQFRVPGYELTPRDRDLMAGSATNFTVSANLTDWVVTLKPQDSR